MIDYYNRQGEAINLEEWSTLLNNFEYKVVACDELEDGKVVSTVWLGLNHNFDGDGPPLIFETMVFASSDDWADLYMDRYATEVEALEGHAKAVALAPTLEAYDED